MTRPLLRLTIEVPGQPPVVLAAELDIPGSTVSRPWISDVEAAEMCGVTVKTVRGWARAGRLEGTKRGRKWWFRERDLDTMLRPVPVKEAR